MTNSRRSVFRGRIVELTLDDVRLPNGNHAELEIVHHPGGAAVVAMDGEGRVCLLRQYRHAFGDWLWELPAGKLEPGEPPAQTARRELAEEGAVEAGRWDGLGDTISSPGVFTEVVHLYLARALRPVRAAPEAHEVFERHWIPLGEAVERALWGDIRDGKTVIGLLRARALLESGQ